YAGYNTADIIQLGGHIFSVKAPGTSMVAMVPWSLIRLIFSPLMQNHEALYWALTTWMTIACTISLLCALMAVVMFRFARHLGASEGRATGIALILSLATIVFPYATEMTGEPFAAVFSFIAFYLIATFDNEPSYLRAFGAGLLAGLAVLNDYPTLTIAAAIGFYTVFKLWRRMDFVLAFSGGAAVGALLLFGYNWGAFGSPLFFSYQAFKLPGNTQFPEQARGFVGLTYPKLTNLWNILPDPQRGLFFCNPVLLLSLPAIGYFFAHRRWRAEWLVTVFSIVTMILFNASYGESIVSWGGGTAVGPRQIIAAVPFMVLTLVFLPRACDWLMGGLGVLSAFIMLMATATNPHFPYEYQNPVVDFATQQFFRADFGTNRDAYFGGGMLTPDSTAFNLGQFVGLPGPYQLWPLALVWIVGILDLVEMFGVFEQRPSMAATGPYALALGISAAFLAPLDGRLATPLGLHTQHGLLGRYYVGEQPGKTPPHMIRIDPQIDFYSVAELGAFPFPSTIAWTGKLIAPTSGDYTFLIQADDDGWLKIDGTTVIADPGMISQPPAQGQIHLSAGPHRIELFQRNIAGDAAMHFSWKSPDGNQEIVPSSALIPGP
ncbi:MAG TPA: PA14 domain-containing protein, partial [Candidatus Binataceae bacterium]|nr:PA14 domain-containing protein [Candidatus Binataceae bacterium]